MKILKKSKFVRGQKLNEYVMAEAMTKQETIEQIVKEA
jgi:hypothetical protein